MSTPYSNEQVIREHRIKRRLIIALLVRIGLGLVLTVGIAWTCSFRAFERPPQIEYVDLDATGPVPVDVFRNSWSSVIVYPSLRARDNSQEHVSVSRSIASHIRTLESSSPPGRCIVQTSGWPFPCLRWAARGGKVSYGMHNGIQPFGDWMSRRFNPSRLNTSTGSSSLAVSPLTSMNPAEMGIATSRASSVRPAGFNPGFSLTYPGGLIRTLGDAPPWVVPLLPAPWAFGINISIYAVIVSLVLQIPRICIWTRERRRARRGQCIRCGYHVGVAQLCLCPECGHRMASLRSDKPETV